MQQAPRTGRHAKTRVTRAEFSKKTGLLAMFCAVALISGVGVYYGFSHTKEEPVQVQLDEPKSAVDRSTERIDSSRAAKRHDPADFPQAASSPTVQPQTSSVIPNPVVTTTKPQSPAQPGGTQPATKPKPVKPVAKKPVAQKPKPAAPAKPVAKKPTPNKAKPAKPVAKKPKPAAPKPNKPKPNKPKPNQPAPVKPSGPEVSQVVQLVNAERAKSGLKPLVVDPCLQNKSAQPWAVTMAKAGKIWHQNMREVMNQCPGQRTVAENVAMWQKDPQHVMRSWMDSAGHRRNIMNSSLTKIGVGIATDAKGRKYWVQVFGG